MPSRAPKEGRTSKSTVKRAGAAPAAGYSGTPLSKKLGVKESSRIFLAGAPKGFMQLLEPLPALVRFAGQAGPGVAIAVIFVTEMQELLGNLKSLRKLLDAHAALWVCWPKKSSGLATAVSENVIRDTALPLGFVDIKVCAINEIWSGLKLVVRKSLR
jgi:hypothetical protein